MGKLEYKFKVMIGLLLQGVQYPSIINQKNQGILLPFFSVFINGRSKKRRNFPILIFIFIENQKFNSYLSCQYKSILEEIKYLNTHNETFGSNLD